MPIHDTSYQHWDGVHLGLWHRRLAIASNGVTRCLQIKGMRHVVTICWVSAIAMAGILFLVGQLLVEDGFVARWLVNLNPQLQSFGSLLARWLEHNPHISVHTTQNLLFYYYCTWLMVANVFALGLVVPLLITRDLGSNAIIIYSSKAVSRADYILGKFSTAFGLQMLTWFGPVFAAWLLGNLLAPDWRFFWHSRAALGNAMLYGGLSLFVLSVLALGVSACSSKEKSTPAFWFMWWILGSMAAPIARQTKPWLQHVSFSFNLNQFATAAFRPADDLKSAQDNIPILGQMLKGIRQETMTALSSPSLGGAIIALGIMLIIAVCLIRSRVKPE